MDLVPTDYEVESKHTRRRQQLVLGLKSMEDQLFTSAALLRLTFKLKHSLLKRVPFEILLVNLVQQPTDRMLVPILPRDKLEAYRKNWTSDSEVGRKFRYQTESRLAGNAVNHKFQVQSLRFLPGTPKALETYRSTLVERFGLFAIGTTLTPNQLRNYLAECGAPI
eukprot:gene42248-52385_t